MKRANRAHLFLATTNAYSVSTCTIIFVTISVTAMDVCGGQRPAFQFARERRRIGGQIFAVSSLCQEHTHGGFRVNKSSRSNRKKPGRWKGKKRRDRARWRERIAGKRERAQRVRLSCATQEVVAPVVDRYEHETRVSTYESPGGTFPCAAPRQWKRDFIPCAIPFEELPAARAEEGSILSFMYESRFLVIVVPSARARARPWPR